MSEMLSLDERYQQLEQVAKYMWRDMNDYVDVIHERAEVDDGVVLADACFIGDVVRHRQQLEALGVIVDDSL